MCPQSKPINQGLDSDPGGVGWARPICHPARLLSAPRMGARGAIWAHIQIW